MVFGALTLRLQLAEADSNAVGGQLTVCEQIEQALLLGVQPGKLPLHAGVEFAQRPLFVVHRFGDPDP
ncbi:hypothetical protein [Nakamurella multipartita]|uniref:hypothetical protein n=1 Tax=Nakamurella multipartita TaxID=53461 RepID=UPI00059BB66C|nr:hypothetical protein [Nakamurella multipartita]